MRSEGISVVVPVYKESATVVTLAERIGDVLSGREFEVLFVDDGSGDGTSAALEEAKRRFTFVRIVKLPRHMGKGIALLQGFSLCRHDIIVTIDGDLQNPPEEMEKLLSALEDFDLVVGWRMVRNDPWHKQFQGCLFNTVLRLLGSPVHDANCGLKAFRRHLISHPFCNTTRYRILAPLAKMAGFKVGEVAVSHQRRRYGRSKFGFLRILSAAVDISLMTILLLRSKPHLLHITSFLFTACAFCFLFMKPPFVEVAMLFASLALLLWASAAAPKESLLAHFRKTPPFVPSSEKMSG